MSNRDRLSALQRLAVHEHDGLGPLTRARIVQAVADQGPAVIRRARRRRRAGQAAMATALGLGVLAAVVLGRADERATRATMAEVVRRPLDARACARGPAPSIPLPAFTPTSRGARELDLGSRGRAVAVPEAVVALAEATPCRTVISLASGRVAVHAGDLGGGELIVRHGVTDVVVHGTIFAVSADARDVTVDVAEGRVGVARRGEPVALVEAGERAFVGPDSVARATLSPPDVEALRRDLTAQVEAPPAAEPELPPAARRSLAPPPPAASATALLAQADARWRARDLDGARALYHRVATGRDSTAEAAWLGLARLELDGGRPGAALIALAGRARHFPDGALGPEAAWIAVRAERAKPDVPAARRRAEELIRRWPAAPQAAAARRWLGGSGAPRP